MKVVIVLGFYDSVFVQLQKAYSALLQNHTIMWVGIIGPHGDGDVSNFRGLLFDRLANKYTEILVLTVVRRDRDRTYEDGIADIVRWAKDRHPNATIDLKLFPYALEFVGVDKEIRGFLGLSSQVEDYPETLKELDSWLQCHAEKLKEKILILPAALGEARASTFEDVALVYKSLSLLANEYWDLRVHGGRDVLRKWRSGLEALGLVVAPSISKSRAGEQRNEYYVTYPSGNLPANNKFLEQHLKKGNARDARFCFRLYFFWDKKKKLVVIGWLPSHLDTRST